MANPSITAPTPPDYSKPEGAWRFIPTTVHGGLDYPMAVLIIVVGFLPGFPNGSGATDIYKGQVHAHTVAWSMIVPIILGALTLIYSALTNYEAGMERMIPFRLHLTFDFMLGLLLAVSPWLFHFSNQVYLPHLIVGLLRMGFALFTSVRPFTSKVGTPS